MGLFVRRREEAPATEERSSYSWAQLSAYLANYTSYFGSEVPIDRALRASAVWGCVRVLAGSASMIPLDVVRVSGGRREPVSPTPALIGRPSLLVERDVWVHQVVSSMMTDGNAWGMVGAIDGRGVPTSIETLDPDAVSGREVRAGVISAVVDGERVKAWPHGPLWHVPGVMVRAGSPFGLSPVRYASTGVDATLMAEMFGRDFFSGGGHPSSVIYSDDPNLDGDGAAAIKRAFLMAAEGREPAVLGSGLKYEQVQVAPGESQFLELLRFEVENACRFFGVPPAMVYGAVSGQNVTYANVSQADLHYLKHSLEVPLTRVETALSRLLLRPQVVKFNRPALLKSDTAARYAAHLQALEGKWRTVNEVRQLEDEQPFDDPACDMPGIPDASAPDAPAPTEGDQ